MKKMIGILGTSLMHTCKTKLEEAKQMIEDFDADATKKELLEMGERMKSEFGVLSNRVKNYVDKFEVSVPYNRETELIFHILEDNNLTVQVQDKNDLKNQTTTFTIPEGVNLNKITQRYDDETKTMFISFSKKF